MSTNYVDKSGLNYTITKLLAMMSTGVFAFTTDSSGNLYVEYPDAGKPVEFEITSSGDVNIIF